MGGIGSGRPSGFGSNTVECNRSIDVNRLQKEGCLTPGWIGNWEWKRDDERVALISLQMERSDLMLNYNYRRYGEEWESVSERVPIIRVPCRFGGSRPYFKCPGVVNGRRCGRRVIKLYGAGAYFLCRHCYRLSYESQRQDGLDRARQRADKIRQRLGGCPGRDEPLPDRPKGMWRRTYEGLEKELLEAEVHAEEVFMAHSTRLLARLGHPDFVGFRAPRKTDRMVLSDSATVRWSPGAKWG